MLQGHEADVSPTLKLVPERVAPEPIHTGESLLDAWIQEPGPLQNFRTDT